MALVKKIDPNWTPSEKPSLQVGETIAVSNPQTLINERKVEYVGEEGAIEKKSVKSVEKPPIVGGDALKLQCSTCQFVAKSEFGLKAHMRKHA